VTGGRLMSVRIASLVALSCALASCKFHEFDNPQRCSKPADCTKTGQMCMQGFCVDVGSSGAGHDAGRDAGRDAGHDAGVSDAGSDGTIGRIDAGADAGGKEACTDPKKPGLCFDGDSALAGQGVCKLGKRQCESTPAGLFYGECVGQVLPMETEVCNGLDDDCDGKIDEDTASTSCMVNNAQGACATGMLTCSGGIARCEGMTDPQVETCDTSDNDCDGKIDEGTDELSYPKGTLGCTSADNVTWNCMGVCKPGKRSCTNGKLADSAEPIVPQSDGCTTTGTAADDDCDGAIDEECTCTSGMMQDCYTGPAGTENMGACRHGTQTCTGSSFGSCIGAIMPVPETCANEGADDNCDGDLDNVPGRGDPCMDATKQGVCRNGVEMCQGGSLVCVTPAPAANEACDDSDDDCDGKVDEGFVLQTDPQHCGSCANACSSSQICCGGQCTDIQTDRNHCGPTCEQCAGTDCCGGHCLDLQTDADNCGSCGNKCAQNDTCCGGQCVNLQMDDDNCSICGNPCSSGQHCCTGSCKDLLTDNNNCSACGKACAILIGIGLTCNCSGGKCSGTLNLCH
jgi:hypothetical protein